MAFVVAVSYDTAMTPRASTVGRAMLWALAAFVSASCSGIFQRSIPDRPAVWSVRATGEEVRVGSAERDITPPIGGYMAGFSLARTSTGIASPLKVRAMVFETGDRRFAIVGIDNLGIMREDSDWLKAGLSGFANGDVFLCASHTHAGPDLIGLWGWYFLTSGRSHDYLRQLAMATSEAVAEARAADSRSCTLVPLRMVDHLGPCCISPAIPKCFHGGCRCCRRTSLAISAMDGRPPATGKRCS